MTETNSIAVGIAGEDYEARPTSVCVLRRSRHRIARFTLVFSHTHRGRACPVNDLIIMKDGVAVPPGQAGEIWLWVISSLAGRFHRQLTRRHRRGPDVMKCYWEDAGTRVVTPVILPA